MKNALFLEKSFNNGTCTSELGLESRKILPAWFIVGFMESNKFDEQTRDISAVDWLLVSSAVCRLGIDR